MTDEHETEPIIGQLLGLPWRAQSEVYHALGDSLGLQEDKPGRRRELTQRAEALDAMRATIEHLGLTPGQQLETREYERARKELGLNISAAAIIRRWGAWREAISVLAGERARTTERQRAHWRAINNSARTHEQHLAGIKRWLDSEPEHNTKSAYDNWALDDENHPEQAPPVTADAITDALALPWKTVLAVVKGKQALPAAQQARLRTLRQEGGPLKLVGVVYIALLYKQSERAAHKLVLDEGFPVPVAYTTMNKRRVWYQRDIDAHYAGKRVPKRKLFEAQDKIILSEELRAQLGLPVSEYQRIVQQAQRGYLPQNRRRANLGRKQDQMRGEYKDGDRRGQKRGENNKTRKRSEDYEDAENLLPKPAGRVNHAHYWLRADIQTWLERHEITQTTAQNKPTETAKPWS